VLVEVVEVDGLQTVLLVLLVVLVVVVLVLALAQEQEHLGRKTREVGVEVLTPLVVQEMVVQVVLVLLYLDTLLFMKLQ
jgi:hypothetical protein